MKRLSYFLLTLALALSAAVCTAEEQPAGRPGLAGERGERPSGDFPDGERGGNRGDGGAAGEHMTSFDYAYKLEAVRDWLFAQSK